MDILFDELTGLHGKPWAVEYIERELAVGRHLSLAVIDLDFFTNINEKIGYAQGDHVLNGFAACLPNAQKVKSVRYGDDEFLLIFIDCSSKFLEACFTDLKREIKAASLIRIEPYKKVPIKYSAGVCLNKDWGRDPYLLLKTAEAALVMAKKKGRNRIEYLENQHLEISGSTKKCATLIGRGLRGDCEEGAEAFFASIKEPYGVEVYGKQELLFVDRSNHKIKKIKDGFVYTVAGNGMSGYHGDNQSAQKTSLSKPSGVAFHEPTGRIYIADTGNHCIRMIENGVITTMAGGNASGYSGDGKDARSAQLNRPGGVVVDRKGNVYTNDYGNNVIRMINTQGIINTIAGSGEYGYEGDHGLAVHAKVNKCYGLCVDSLQGFLYLADYGNHCVRKVDLRTGIITTLAMLAGPFWICINSQSDVFIADADANCIKKVDAKTNIITTVAGNKMPGYVDSSITAEIRMNLPAGIVIRDGILYFADYGNNAIRKVVL